jgi:hypothetical protein
VTVLLTVSALGLMLIPVAALPWGRRLPPEEWSRACLGCLVAGAVALELALVMTATPTLLRAAGVHDLAHACERVLHATSPRGGLFGWGAVALAAWSGVTAVVVCRHARGRQRAAWVEPGVGARVEIEGHEVVVLESGSMLALSIAGPTPQVVVSSGTVEELDHAELTAVVHHELAHLRHGHDRYLLVGATIMGAFAWLPLARLGAYGLATALERWADEDAAAHAAGGRPAVRSALVRFGRCSLTPHLATFASHGSFAERLRALDGPAPRLCGRRRILVYAAMAALSAAVLLSVTTCGV